MHRFLLATALAGIGAAAVAQTAPPSTPPTAAASAPGLADEIIVTAQRRAERLIDVPVSVVATTGDRLEKLNFTAATDLQFVTPGLSLGDSNTPRGAGFRVRGIGTNVFTDSIEQSVGTVVDGVTYARAGQGLADLADIERVEVLRGPQGLLFGRNASAGLINIVTRKPGDATRVVLNAAYGTDSDIRVSGSISGPIGGGFGAGISGYYNHQDGFLRDLAIGRDINTRNEYGWRGVLRYQGLDDRLEVLVRGDYSRRDNECCGWSVRQFASPATDPRPGVAFLSSLTGPIASGPNALQNNATASYHNFVESRGVSGEINFKLGDYTLTSITAYRRWSQQDNNDADLSPYNVLDENTGINELEQTSQELRLTSPADRRVTFVAGLFYYDVSNAGFGRQAGRFTIGLARAQAFGIPITLAPGLVLPPGQNFGRDVNTLNQVRDLAAFGQANVKIAGGLELLLGGRVTDTRATIAYDRFGTPGESAFNFVVGPTFAPLKYSGKVTETNLSWKVGPQYKISPDMNVYGFIARGYKGPGFNSALDSTLLQVPPGVAPGVAFRVKPEIPTDYELGFKGQFLQRRVTLNVSLFRTDFKNFQAQIYQVPAGQTIGTFIIANAGSLRTQGFEVEGSARPFQSLSIDLGVAYADTYYRRFTGAACPRLGLLVTTVGAPCGPTVAGGANAASFDASGRTATNAPAWTYTAGFRFDPEIGLPVRPFVQANLYARSSTKYGLYPTNVPNPTIQPAYAVVNAQAGITAFDDRLSVAAYARNLFDKRYVTSIFDIPFDGAGGLGQFVTRDAQRTIGVQVNVRY